MAEFLILHRPDNDPEHAVPLDVVEANADDAAEALRRARLDPARPGRYCAVRWDNRVEATTSFALDPVDADVPVVGPGPTEENTTGPIGEIPEG